MSLLVTHRLTMKFGGLTAVDNVSMTIQPGRIHALIGPNGAGKSTFINMISGIYRPASGEIWFNGSKLKGGNGSMFSQLGISRIFQNLRLFKQLTVMENVLIGLHNQVNESFIGSLLHTPGLRAEEKKAAAEAEEILASVGLWESRNQLASSLPYGKQKWLEVARALASKPKLLLLDEPAAGLNPTESDELETFIRLLPSSGITVLLIEHDMRLVMRLAEDITVLNFGRVIAEGTPKEIQNHPVVIEAYLGKGRTHATAG